MSDRQPPYSAPDGGEDPEDLFENAPCGYVLAGQDGRITRINRTFADWMGAAPAHLVGQRLPDLLNIAGKIYYETHFAPLLRLQGSYNELALDLRREDGTVLPVLVNAVERRDAAGAIHMRLAIFNATERRLYERQLLSARRAAEQANAELRELNLTLETRLASGEGGDHAGQDALHHEQKIAAIGQLTGGVAHDFNNLLTVIGGSAELLRLPGLGDNRRERYLEAISETVARATKLTGQLLAFARRQTLQPMVFDVCASVSTIRDMVTTLAGARIAIETEMPDIACLVRADPSQFDTAMVNLIVNARDAMNGQGRLTIAVAPATMIPAIREHWPVTGDFVRISVCDTGPGIPAESVDRVFEPFFTTKEAGRGKGLGLSQVFAFAKQAGGSATVHSRPGHGATFSVYLPRAPEPVPVALPPEEAQPQIDGRGHRILVVEDNAALGTFAMQALHELGFETRLVGSAEEALAHLAEAPGLYDVIFSDVAMPGMNGIDFALEVRRRYDGLPVVLTSGYNPAQVDIGGYLLVDEGALGFEFLHKPYSIEQLSRALFRAASATP